MLDREIQREREVLHQALSVTKIISLNENPIVKNVHVTLVCFLNHKIVTQVGDVCLKYDRYLFKQ